MVTSPSFQVARRGPREVVPVDGSDFMDEEGEEVDGIIHNLPEPLWGRGPQVHHPSQMW